VDSVHRPWTTSDLHPRWTAAVANRGEGGREGRGGAGGALTGHGAAVKRSGDGGKAAVMKCTVGESSGTRDEERRVVWGAARWSTAGVPFIGAEGEGGDRTVERHDGGGGSRFKRGSTGE
jgi:hypothetical protein